MTETQLRNQTSIRVVPSDEAVVVRNGQIHSDEADQLPANCFVVPMKILAEPEPIRRSRG
jgi:hypothetical protein